MTRLLRRAREGDGEALQEILPLVYEELRRLAAGVMAREAGPRTLSPTALLHETYLRLAGGPPPAESRSHFLALAARVMRQVLVDQARRRRAEKRGGDQQRTTLDGGVPALAVDLDQVILLDRALDRLEARAGERARRVVECRFFGGMTEVETATALGVTSRTVRRDWVGARAWLYREIYGREAPGD